jgi:hypothetical protein
MLISEWLAVDLTEQFGRGFGKINLWRMRAFFQEWLEEQILSTPLRESGASFSFSAIARRQGGRSRAAWRKTMPPD